MRPVVEKPALPAEIQSLVSQLQSVLLQYGFRINRVLPKDGSEGVESYTVAALPDVPSEGSGIIFVSDETGGAVLAFSDGSNWRRVTDRAVVS